MNPDHMEPSAGDFGGLHDLELSGDELLTLSNALDARANDLADRIEEMVNAGNDEQAKDLLLTHWKVYKLAGRVGSIIDR